MLKELNCLLLLISKLLYWSLFKTSQKYIFCDMSCECPHRLSDKLLKSSCNIRCRCRSSALLRGCVYYVSSPSESSVVFQLFRFSLLSARFSACCSVSVRAHYRHSLRSRKCLFQLFFCLLKNRANTQGIADFLRMMHKKGALSRPSVLLSVVITVSR